jgi:hypothetical protein
MASVKSINLESTYCYCCDEDIVPELGASVVTDEIQGISFSYVELAAICPKCGEEIYVGKINDINVHSRISAYFGARTQIICARQNGKTLLMKELYKGRARNDEEV